MRERKNKKCSPKCRTLTAGTVLFLGGIWGLPFVNSALVHQLPLDSQFISGFHFSSSPFHPLSFQQQLR